MIKHTDFEDNEKDKLKLRQLINEGKVVLGGNASLKIYGTLQCKSGKQMERKNRVFFSSEKEAINSGYRPCAHCMRDKYLEWKASK
jgi:methylphosphotriester-DNA--protein-cysteine methyltransferase